MANQEHLNILKQGVEVWNQWRKQHTDIKPDLSETYFDREVGIRDSYPIDWDDLDMVDSSRTDLSGIDFSQADLYGANLLDVNLYRSDLSGTDLRMSQLRTATLSEANLRGASLIGANLYRTDLILADLTEADLSQANLKGADLKGSDLKGAQMSSTILVDVDLRGVEGLEAVKHRGPSCIGIDTIYKSWGDIPEAFLKGAGVDDTFITYVHSLVGKPFEYYSCFISYSSKDEAFAHRLYADLQSNNVRCWFAPEHLKIGDKFRHRIDESIRMYDKLLLVLSEASLGSTWVSYEVEKALNKEPEGIPNVLFPIRLDRAILTCGTDWAKDIRKSRHIGDFEHWKDHDAYQIAFERLLRDLKAQS